jgi:ferritin-like metal-binding protein YciE
MTSSSQKILQYLNEAHASEVGLVRVLQSQIAIAPRGSYRTGLETHLRETRGHADRLQARIRALGDGGGVLQGGIGVAESIAAQALALGKAPLDLLRGSGGEEKVLKNAKDACATEALEIATYTALERLASSVGDEETARLAASIRADEERMLQRILKEVPKLTDAVVGADVRGNGSYDVARTGAADATRSAGRATRSAAGKGAASAKRTGRKAARATGVAEPWPGYDKQTVEEISARLARSDDRRARAARAYEKAHKDRTGVLEAAERELAKS